MVFLGAYLLGISIFTASCLWPPRIPKGNSKKQPLEVFCKKDVLENFANLTGKHLY